MDSRKLHNEVTMEQTKHEPNLLSEVYDSETFRTTGHEIVDLLANHLKKVQSDRSEKANPYHTPDSELSFWQKNLNSDESSVETFSTVLNHAVQLQHPKYMGHQAAAPAPMASLAGFLADFLNNGTGVFEMGPASNALEKIVTDFVAKEIGYGPEASGILTSGGTLANLTGLLAARKANAPGDVWKNGHKEKLAIMVSEEAHYCIDRAARIMGLGDEGMIRIPVDDDFKVQTDLLSDYLREAKQKNFHVMALIGCAGTTATGSYDDLEKLADFCDQHDIWFHVDGAHGGAVVFSDKYRGLAKAIERADSIVIDFHKMLMTPALNTALMFKNGREIYQTFAQTAQYLWDTPEAEEWYNSGKRTFECTKQLMSFKIYILMKTYGTNVFEQNVNRLYDSGRILARLIAERSCFELAIVPETNIVNFRYLTPQGINTNEINSSIRQKLLESGEFYIVQTAIKGKRFLRCVVMNPFTTEEDFCELLNEIEKIGESLVAVHK